MTDSFTYTQTGCWTGFSDGENSVCLLLQLTDRQGHCSDQLGGKHTAGSKGQVQREESLQGRSLSSCKYLGVELWWTFLAHTVHTRTQIRREHTLTFLHGWEALWSLTWPHPQQHSTRPHILNITPLLNTTVQEIDHSIHEPKPSKHIHTISKPQQQVLEINQKSSSRAHSQVVCCNRLLSVATDNVRLATSVNLSKQHKASYAYDWMNEWVKTYT